MKKSVLLTLCLVGQLVAQNCILTVPASPLSGAGLATPYLQQGCMQNNPNLCSFVQGVILDTGTTGAPMYVYNPLVIDMGTTAAVTPTAPILPASNVVGIWFGTNGNTLTLMDNGAGSLQGGNCVNGIINPSTGMEDIFGQFAYCNAISFFTQALNLLPSMAVPALGVDVKGNPCPTIRDFFIVDQDQSDNVNSVYLVTQAGLVAQNNTANIQKFNPPAAFLQNGSDNVLLIAVDTAIGCNPWRVPDLGDPATNGFAQNHVPASAINELHAQKWQQAPIAYVPLSDPMTRENAGPSLAKTNAYREGTGQPIAANGGQADQVDYCFNLYLTFPLRFLGLMGYLVNYPSPMPTVADSLYTFLGQRFVASFGAQNLDCFDLLQIPLSLPPLRLNLNGDGLVVGVVVTPPNNGPTNPIYAATTGVAIVNQNGTPISAVATTTSSTTWTTGMIVGVAVGGGVGLCVIIGFIVAFRAHKVRNFFSGVRDGIATKLRD